MGKNQKGITLIALIITIIVMLILVGVTINVALNGGLFQKAKNAASGTQKQADKEELLVAVFGTVNSRGDLDVASLTIDGWTKSAAKQDTGGKTYYEFTKTKTGNKFYVYAETGEILEEEPTQGQGPVSTAGTITIVGDEVISLSTTQANWRTKTLSVSIEGLSGENVTWTSGNTNYVTVEGAGTTATITAVATGQTTITASAQGAESVTFTVLVNPWEVWGLTSSDVQFDAGYTGTIYDVTFYSNGGFNLKVGVEGTPIDFLSVYGELESGAYYIMDYDNSSTGNIFLMTGDDDDDGIYDGGGIMYFKDSNTLEIYNIEGDSEIEALGITNCNNASSADMATFRDRILTQKDDTLTIMQIPNP